MMYVNAVSLGRHELLMALEDAWCERLILSIHILRIDFSNRWLGWGIHLTLSCPVASFTGGEVFDT